METNAGRKVRADAKLDQLNAAQHARLHGWLEGEENRTYSEVVRLVRQEFGLSVGKSAVSVYCWRHVLPALDGWAVLAQLRRTRATPVLMLTARDAPTDRVRGLDTGADDYLVKPFDLAELFARVRALIRRAAGQAASTIELGDVTIDVPSRAVARSGQPVALTAREYAILEFLALHRGQIVLRAALYEHIFDENDDTLSNLLEVHIFSIRKKLRPDLITTRRGQGYCVEG